MATPQWNFLDLITSTFGLLTRRSLLDGLESYTLEARGWFYGGWPAWRGVACGRACTCVRAGRLLRRRGCLAGDAAAVAVRGPMGGVWSRCPLT